MGLLGIIQNDIKRVVAYSTLSQLGYMTVALGVSAYSAGVFHLMTHAFFKALLFLAAGSVIIGMHHDQDIRNMGGLWRRMPITWITSLIGSLALIGFPFFAGFFSKDAIIEAVALSKIPGAGYAYFCVIVGVFVTAFYSFRMYFLVFHGEERFHHKPFPPEHDEGHGHAHAPKESPWVVTVPLVLLAIPSVVIGYLAIEPMLFGSWFGPSIVVNAANNVLAEMGHEFHGAAAMALHGFASLPFALALSGLVLAWVFYIKAPAIPAAIKARLTLVNTVLENKYYFDKFYEGVIAAGARALGRGLWKGGDVALIDGVAVNGTARLVGGIARLSRLVQTGHIYQYAFSTIIGVVVLLWFWGRGI
jgi:NADH-quinone oxidoreductase subunit L